LLIAAGLLLAALGGWGLFANALIGAAAGYGLIWGLRELWLRGRGEDGIGLGDAKLLAGAGAWAGWVGLPQVLLLASGIALVCVAFGKISRLMKSENLRLPFGPFLALGLWLVWRTGGLVEHFLIG
jgi:leader peptidase (prepilin peptidase)/N-methyltransferase